MCWIGIANPIIAKEDIVCFKVVKKFYPGVYVPYFRYTSTTMGYKIGETYKSDVVISYGYDGGYNAINEGLHCYDSTAKVKYSEDGIEIFLNGRECAKLYSYDNDPAVLKCIIPKGTKYYKNKHGEIVTEKLIIIGLL